MLVITPFHLTRNLIFLGQMHDRGFRDKALPKEKYHCQHSSKKYQALSVLYHVIRHSTAFPVPVDDAYL